VRSSGKNFTSVQRAMFKESTQDRIIREEVERGSAEQGTATTLGEFAEHPPDRTPITFWRNNSWSELHPCAI
jgi:hypothetical protein